MMETNNTNKLAFYKGLLLGLLIAGVGGLLWGLEAEQRGRWIVEKDALLTGMARYGVDSVTAQPIFEWNK